MPRCSASEVAPAHISSAMTDRSGPYVCELLDTENHTVRAIVNTTHNTSATSAPAMTVLCGPGGGAGAHRNNRQTPIAAATTPAIHRRTNPASFAAPVHPKP